MALVHKTKKEEGEKHKTKHKTKKKTQKKQQIFRIKLRKDRFRMFGPHSKPISAFFGCFGQSRPLADTIQFSWYDLILAESVWIGAELAWISEKKKKKKLRRGTNMRAAASVPHPASDSSAAPSHPHRCFLVLHIHLYIQLSIWQSPAL